MDVATFHRPETLAWPQGTARGALLRLRLVGAMEAENSSGASVLPPGRKTRALLGVVALAAPRPVSRAKLADLLWGRRPELQARASLRQEIHRLADALAPVGADVLQVRRDHVGLWPGLVWTDVGELREASGPDASSLALLTGTLLDGLDGADPAFDDWLRVERERFGDHVRGLAELQLGAQVEPEATIAAAKQLLAIDRAHEGGWRALMRAYVARGERGMAIEAYERCRVALSAVRDASPSAETEALLAELQRSSSHSARSIHFGSAHGRQAGPRIGVLPLTPIGSVDPELGIGIAEEITGALARLRSLCVVACPPRPHASGLLGGDLPSRRALGVDLVLEGTVQRGGKNLRVLLRLLDLRAGDQVIWTRRFDDQGNNPLDLQDEIAASAAAELEGVVMLLEGRRAALGNSAIQPASELLARALPMMLRLERNQFHEAGRLIAKALELEPASASALAWHALWHALLVGQNWTQYPIAAAARAGALAERAIRIDPTDARVLAIAGQIRAGLRHRPREALVLYERALARNPNLAMAWALFGLAHVYLGEFDEAERQLDRYKMLSPLDPQAGFLDLGFVATSLLRHNHARASILGRQASELNPGFCEALKLTLAALGHLGRRQEAALVMRRLLAISPGFTVARAVATSPFVRPPDTDHIAAGLRLAGVPMGERAASGQNPASE